MDEETTVIDSIPQQGDVSNFVRNMSDELGECHFGSLEGKIMDDGWFHKWQNGENFNGESHDQFLKRVRRGLDLALDQPGPVLIVSHGIFYYALCVVLKMKSDLHLSNCVPIKHFLDEDGSWRTIPKQYEKSDLG